MRFLVMMACAVGLFLAAPQADARPLGANGATLEEVGAALRARGLPVAYGSNSTGETIQSSSGGINFDIWFFNCRGARCASFEAGACFTMRSLSQETVGTFNRDRRLGRAYFADNGDVCLASDMLAAHGSTEQLEVYVDEWTALLAQFVTDIGFRSTR